MEHWSLTTLREKLVKIGAKVVRHGRYVTYQMAEVAVPRNLFRKILRRINELRRRPAPAWAEGIDGEEKATGAGCLDGSQKFSVYLLKSFGVVQNYFWYKGASFEMRSPFELEKVSFRTQNGSFCKPF